MKRLLHLSAMIASHSDNELRNYYQKRLDEGKHRMEVLNIIRNKIVARVFAVVKRGTPYVELGKYVA